MDVSKPDVYCPKENKRVPVWWCIGSFVQQKERCPHLVEIKVDYGEMKAWRRCGLEEEV